MNAHVSSAVLSTTAAFAVGDLVRDGEWACRILAPACAHGFYPVQRLYDDEGKYQVVHGAGLALAELTEDEADVAELLWL